MKLYILIVDSCDGSYYNKFVLDPSVIARLQNLYDQDLMDYSNGFGVDSDGFHYDEINVPDTSTLETLGLNKWDMLTHEEIDEAFGKDSGMS